MQFSVLSANQHVGAGALDGPLKIGTIFRKINVIACGNMILHRKITGASRGPPPTHLYRNGTLNYNFAFCNPRYRWSAMKHTARAPGPVWAPMTAPM